MAGFESRGYSLGEVIDKDHLNISRKAFNNHFRNDTSFPKPYVQSGNLVMYWGTAIQYWLDKKSGR